jgi:hypothetical protein
MPNEDDSKRLPVSGSGLIWREGIGGSLRTVGLASSNHPSAARQDGSKARALIPKKVANESTACFRKEQSLCPSLFPAHRLTFFDQAQGSSDFSVKENNNPSKQETQKAVVF